MSEELVEQLARRLFEVREAEWRELRPDLNPVSWDDGPETMRELNRAVARECLRQMEWASRCGHDDGLRDATGTQDEEWRGEIRLAPEDWKP